MSAFSIEDTCGKVGPYLHEHCRDLPVSSTRHAVFPVGELAVKTGTSPHMIGKIRKHYRRALAQSMTPGCAVEFEIVEQSYFGKTAIAVRRIRSPSVNEK